MDWAATYLMKQAAGLPMKPISPIKPPVRPAPRAGAPANAATPAARHQNIKTLANQVGSQQMAPRPAPPAPSMLSQVGGAAGNLLQDHWGKLLLGGALGAGAYGLNRLGTAVEDFGNQANSRLQLAE